MNKLQQREVELLKVFVDFCDRHSLRYFLVCGSALGAVKYNGFIPWDDDIDVGMPRADYERFLATAPSELPAHIFLQNYRTDTYFPHVFSKLRNSQTTFIEANMSHLKMNHGIYIDIFPLDGYPTQKKEIKKLERRKKVLNWLHYCALDNQSSKKVAIRDGFFRLLGFHKRTHKTLARLDALISAYSAETSAVWCNHGNWQGKLEYAPQWHYGDGVKAQFEGVQVTVPARYDEYLTQKYGDWRSDPPLEKQHSHHNVLVCDTHKSYEEYL